MRHGNGRHDARRLEPFIGRHQIPQRLIGIGQVIVPGAQLGPFDQPRQRHERETMMLLVVGQEHGVRELAHNLGVQHRLVPLHHLL